MHVLFAGMRGSGKSTLCVSASQALETRYRVDVGLHELDIWSDTHPCILGEKPWDQRNKRGHTHPGDELLDEYLAAIEAFASDRSRIVLGDLPGRVHRMEHDVLTKVADGVVLVDRARVPNDWHESHPADIESWERALDRLDLPVIAAIRSALPDEQTALGQITVDGLDRRPIPNHPGVQDLAEILYSRYLSIPPFKEERARETERIVKAEHKRLTGADSPATI